MCDYDLILQVWSNLNHPDPQKWKGSEAKIIETCMKAQYIYYDSKLLVSVVCFAELVSIGLWAIWAEQDTL